MMVKIVSTPDFMLQMMNLLLVIGRDLNHIGSSLRNQIFAQDILLSVVDSRNADSVEKIPSHDNQNLVNIILMDDSEM